MIRANRLFHLRRSASRSVYILSAILVVAIGIGIYSYFFSKSALASWFNENWLYRVPIALTNSSGSDQTDFQVSFTLDTATLITAGKMQSSCNDLRVTDINGNLLPQWIEESNPGCNSATTKVWVKVPSISTSGQTIYVYYGNSSASSAQAPQKVFEFFDDFNNSSLNTSKWTTSGSPAISSNALSLTNAKLLSNIGIGSTASTRTVGFRAKTTSTSVDTARFGFSDTSTLATSYYNSDSAHIVMGQEETYLSNTGSTNLISHHKLEETTSTDANQFKASGYLDTGKLSQGASLYGNAAGTIGSTLTVNRGTQISGNNYEHINTNQGTISFWVKPNWARTDGRIHQYFIIGTTGGDRIELQKAANSTNYLVITGGDRTSTVAYGHGNMSAGNWYHIVVKWDYDNTVNGTNYGVLYINNSLQNNYDTNQSATPIAPHALIRIGADSSGQNQVDGLIDDFAIYDRVLTTTEITDIYNSGTGKEAGSYADSSLKFYAKMDGSGTLSPVTYNAAASASKMQAASGELTGGTNLIADGNQEGADTSSWTMGGSLGTGTLTKTTTAANVLYDTQAMQVDVDGNGRGMKQLITLTGGNTYHLEYWYKLAASQPNPVYDYLYDNTDTVLLNNGQLLTADGSWHKREAEFKVGGSGSHTVQMWPGYQSGTTAGTTTFYVDNVIVTPNLIDDGGMEGTLTDAWTQETDATMATDTSEHSGAQEMKITAGAANVGAKQSVTLVSGNSYLISAWARVTSGDTAVLALDPGSGATANITTTTSTSYTRLSGVVKASGTAGVVYLRGSANTDIVWFDDISVIPLDNTALTFKSWAPVDDTASAANDISVHGDSDGVTTNATGVHGAAYTFDGATGFLRQKTYDVNIGTLTYEDTNTDIADTGQEFGDWDNAGGTGSAEYMIVVTNSDNTTSWGYFCAEDTGTQTAVYTLKACTGGSEGFNGTDPSGKTPVGYEIRKSDYQITGDITVGAWVNGSGFSSGIISKTGDGTDTATAGFELRRYTDNGTIWFTRKASVNDTRTTTALSAGWNFVVGVVSSGTWKIYINGAEATYATQLTGTTISDNATPLKIGIAPNSSVSNYFNGSIDSPFVISSALTTAQIQALYNAGSTKYTYNNGNAAAQTLTDSATAMDTNYHVFEISQQSSAVSYQTDGAAASTVSTNSPDSSQYIRLENTDASNAVNVDYVYVRKYVATAPSAGAAGTEEQGKGPVGYWSLDDGQGIVAQDKSSSGNDGTITGATWQPEDRCVAGKCLYFDGSGDYVDVGSNASLNPTTAITLSAWIRVHTLSGSAWVLSNSNSNDPYYDYAIEINNSNSIKMKVTNASGTIYTSTNATLSLDTWTYIAATYDGSTMKFYKNGTLIGSTDVSGLIGYNGTGNHTKTYIASWGGSENAFKGFIDDAKIYPYARSAAEVKTDYEAGKANAAAHSGTSAALGSQPQDYLSNGLVGYWKMDDAGIDAEGETITDSSGNSNTGTLYGDNSTGDNGTGLDCTATGKYGTGCSLDGTDDYVDTGTKFPSVTSTITISAWVKPGTTQAAYADIWGNHQSDYKGIVLQQNNTSTNSFSWNYGNGTSWEATSGNTQLTASVWQHVVAVADGTYCRLYVNGVEATKGSCTGAIAPATSINFMIGQGFAGSVRPFNGSVDEIRVYNRALSSAEISSLYNWAPGPVAYYDFEEKTGTTANDKSGNGLTGTLGGDGSGTDLPTWTTGKYGTGLKFDGSDDHTLVADNNNLSSTNKTMTINAWIKGNAFGDDNGIVVKRAADNFEYGFYVAASKLTFNMWTSAGVSVCSTVGNATLSTNTWYFATIVADGSNCMLYLNGVRDGTAGAISGTVTNGTAGVYIGYDNSGVARYFNGSIDEVKIYNYARSQKQIVSDMNGNHPNVGSPIGSAVGHWKFNEGQGITANNSGNGGSTLNGTLSGMSSPSTTTSGWNNFGRFSKALNFDGSDDVITITNSNTIDMDTNLANFTYSAWINPSSAGENNVGQIFQKGAGTYFRVDNPSGSSLDVEANLDLATTDANVNVSAPITINTWHYLAATWDGTTLTVYIDGVKRGTGTGSGAISADANNLLLGGTTTANFAGTIDDVKLYNYALTANEVKIDMNAGANLNFATGSVQTNDNPVAYWKMDESNTTPLKSGGSCGTSCDLTSNTGSMTTGKINGALQLADAQIASCSDATCGGTSGIDLDSSSVTGLTLEAWIYPTSLNGTYNIIFDKVAGPGQGYRLYVYGSSLRAIFGNSACNNNNTVTYGGTIVVNKWQHVAVTLTAANPGTATVYVNGVAVGTPATDAYYCNVTTDFSIGLGSGIGFMGKIDEAKIYKYPRSATQIKADAMTDKYTPSFEGTPIGEWNFEEGNGATVYDISGNGYSGAITGATFRPGKLGKALNFNGGSDVVDTISSISDIKTVSFWAYPSSTTANLIDLQTAPGTINISASSGTISATGFTSPTYYINGIQTAAPTLTANTWNHIEITTETAITGSAVRFGRISTTSMTGKLDAIKFYDYARSQAQVAWDFNRGAPVGHWKLDECQGGTAYDSSGNKNNGTITIGASGEDTLGTCTTSSTAWGTGATGKRNASLSFDGTDDYITTSYTYPDYTNGITMTTWFKTTYSGGNNALLFGNGTGTGTKNSFLYINGSDNTVHFAGDIVAGAIFNLTCNSSAVNDGNWHLAIGVWDGTTNTSGVKCYVDGKQVGTATSTSTNTSSASVAFQIGAWNSTTTPFNGQIDDVRVYNYALNATQVKDIMNNGAINFGPSTGAP